ncbi:MAG: hypothetical protein WCV69_00785 [Patescibacteria group bacterium]|jgi:hypothetical protein
MFQNKFVLDAVIAIIVSVVAALVNNSTKLKVGWRAIITTALLAVGVLAASWNHHWLFFAPSAVVEDVKTAVTVGKTAGKEVSHNFPWFRVVLALLVAAITALQAYYTYKPRPWLGNKRDTWAFYSTIVTGVCLTLGILTFGHMVTVIFWSLATGSTMAIMNIQVPEQELWTPKLFGRRCFHAWWMFDKYVFYNGFHRTKIPRNAPGLEFNVVLERRGLQLSCVTEKIPTLGGKIPGLDGEPDIEVGGDVNVKFIPILDGPENLNAYWSAPPEVRTDAGLVKYASEIFGADFRVLLKGQTLEKIQVGGVFEDANWDEAIARLESVSGYKVKSVLIEDPTPSPEVQARLNELAAKRIDVVKTALDKRIAVITAEGKGDARLAELMPLVTALNNPDIGSAVKLAVDAVAKTDFAGRSELRVLVDRQLGSIAPYIAEGAEAA